MMGRVNEDLGPQPQYSLREGLNLSTTNATSCAPSSKHARLAIAMIVVAGIAASCGRDGGGGDAATLVRKAEQSVLRIEVVPSGPGLEGSRFAAAAVVIRPGFALTAMHVLEHAKIERVMDSEGQNVDVGPLLTADPSYDLALLTVAPSVPPAPLDGSALQVGDTVTVVGPQARAETTVGVVDRRLPENLGPRFSGVALLELHQPQNAVQLTAGSAVIDAAGRVVGILVAGVGSGDEATLESLGAGPLLVVPLGSVKDHFWARADSVDPEGDGWDWRSEASAVPGDDN